MLLHLQILHILFKLIEVHTCIVHCFFFLFSFIALKIQFLIQFLHYIVYKYLLLHYYYSFHHTLYAFMILDQKMCLGEYLKHKLINTLCFHIVIINTIYKI